MIKIAAACLAAATLCAGCLTKEELDCWYDDMCLSMNGPPATSSPGAAPLLAAHGAQAQH